MSAIDYLREDGEGPFKVWHVPDLVAATPEQVRLAFVFESPHVKELAAGLPVVGPSGRSAMRYLSHDPAANEPLGQFVAQRVSKGDGRIAIVNVCNVPMQAAAFGEGDGPNLDSAEWALIEKVRTSRSLSLSSMRAGVVRATSEVLVDRLRARLAAIGSRPDCTVVAAGAFAQRMVAVQDDLTNPALGVPHPSYNQWNRQTNQHLEAMMAMRALFAELTV
jgi:hypothetical protein